MRGCCLKRIASAVLDDTLTLSKGKKIVVSSPCEIREFHSLADGLVPWPRTLEKLCLLPLVLFFLVNAEPARDGIGACFSCDEIAFIG